MNEHTAYTMYMMYIVCMHMYIMCMSVYIVHVHTHVHVRAYAQAYTCACAIKGAGTSACTGIYARICPCTGCACACMPISRAFPCIHNGWQGFFGLDQLGADLECPFGKHEVDLGPTMAFIRAHICVCTCMIACIHAYTGGLAAPQVRAGLVSEPRHARTRRRTRGQA